MVFRSLLAYEHLLAGALMGVPLHSVKFAADLAAELV